MGLELKKSPDESELFGREGSRTSPVVVLSAPDVTLAEVIFNANHQDDPDRNRHHDQGQRRHPYEDWEEHFVTVSTPHPATHLGQGCQVDGDGGHRHCSTK